MPNTQSCCENTAAIGYTFTNLLTLGTLAAGAAALYKASSVAISGWFCGGMAGGFLYKVVSSKIDSYQNKIKEEKKADQEKYLLRVRDKRKGLRTRVAALLASLPKEENDASLVQPPASKEEKNKPTEISKRQKKKISKFGAAKILQDEKDEKAKQKRLLINQVALQNRAKFQKIKRDIYQDALKKLNKDLPESNTQVAPKQENTLVAATASQQTSEFTAAVVPSQSTTTPLQIVTVVPQQKPASVTSVKPLKAENPDNKAFEYLLAQISTQAVIGLGQAAIATYAAIAACSELFEFEMPDLFSDEVISTIAVMGAVGMGVKGVLAKLAYNKEKKADDEYLSTRDTALQEEKEYDELGRQIDAVTNKKLKKKIKKEMKKEEVNLPGNAEEKTNANENKSSNNSAPNKPVLPAPKNLAMEKPISPKSENLPPKKADAFFEKQRPSPSARGARQKLAPLPEEQKAKMTVQRKRYPR